MNFTSLIRLFILMILLMFGSVFWQEALAQVNFNLPDTINNSKLPKQQRILGTKLFLDIPSGFEYAKLSGRLIKSKKTTISIHYYSTIPFDKSKSMLDDPKMIDKQDHVIYKKEFHMNGYNAVFMNTISHQTDESIILLFGNENFSIGLSGEYLASDSLSRRLIANAILQCSYDKYFELKESELFFSAMNLQKTDFKLMTNKSFGQIYTHEGKGSFSNVPSQTQIVLSILPDTLWGNLSVNGEVKQLEKMGFVISKIDKSEIIKNGLASYIVSFNAVKESHEAVGFYFFKGNEKGVILFNGLAFEDFEKNMATFRLLEKSVQIE